MDKRVTKIKLNKALDLAIRNDEIKNKPTLSYGYVMWDGRVYENYLSNESFDEFVDKIPFDVRIMLENGKSQQLKERKNRYGVTSYPPKMASFGSSCRILYNLTKNILYFGYEIELPTALGDAASIDGYTFTKEKHIYIEAKCREPYGVRPNRFSTKYLKLYKYLTESYLTELRCKITNIDEVKKQMTVNFYIGEKELKHFDLKQIINKLLGIGTGILADELRLKPVDFLYLLYNPEALEFEDMKTKNMITHIYRETCREGNRAVTKGLFKAILLFLKTEYYPCKEIDIDDFVDKFSFGICSQVDFSEKVKQ